ncbi:neurofilament medium polypeptide isoform X2 [Pseudorasbora parva]|uniref:neurofilament medium polypeptide isoform X2 n=1 Tax=Pseudorasbora parva TaxID=51549 RepID=UPI00351F10ED
MGNSWDCCGQKNPCDHTEDETKGLLHSSESKTSTRAGTEGGTSPTSDEENRDVEEETKKMDELIVTKQPNAEAQIPKAQSSYSTTISILHTEVSLAAEETAPKEAIILAKETPKTITEVTEEIQNTAAEVSEAPEDTVEATVKIVAPVKEEIEAQRGSIEKVDVAAALTDDAGATATSLESTVAPAEETPVKEAPVQEVTVLTQVEAKNFSEPEPETHMEMIADEKEIIQTEDLPLDDTTETAGLNDTENISLMDSSNTEHDSCILGQLNESDVTGKSADEVTAEEPITEPTAEVEEKHSEDTHSEMVGQMQETFEASQTQAHAQEVSSPGMDITNALSPGIENGLVKDSGNERNADVIVVEKLPQEEDLVQKPNEEALETCQEQLPSKPSTQTDSSNEVNKPEFTDVMTDLEKSEKVVEQEQEATEPTQNGLDSTCASVASSPIENNRATEPLSDAVAAENTEAKGEITLVTEAKLLEEVVKGVPETGPQQTEEAKEKHEEEASVVQENEGIEDTSNTQKEEIIFSSGTVEMKLMQPKEPEESVEEVQEPLDESADLYLGAEDIEMGARNDKPAKPLLELTIPGVEPRCSLAPAVDILAYSEREWKGNTTKSTLIRKGYSEMSHSFSGLRRVRGDNYCALRATLYQVLATSTNVPTWIQDEGFLLLPEKIEAREHLIGGWVFPPECKWASEVEDSVERLKYYLDLLKKKWQAAAACESPEEKQNLCERVFQGGEEEYGLMEALKFLMLAKAVELHQNMVADQEVPVFCWLLFARDTSENPQTLLANHLSQIGFSGGVEQAKMFLLGYALKHTIQAFRLYMTDTEEFVSHYPDDHKQEWPCVCIVTEDDRHYNVPVRRTVQHQHREDITMT